MVLQATPHIRHLRGKGAKGRFTEETEKWRGQHKVPDTPDRFGLRILDLKVSVLAWGGIAN